MNFDSDNIYRTFESVKETHDFKEYFDEMNENNKVLNEIPFDAQKAKQRISKLTSKYRIELNMLACIYGNNMSVTNQPFQKHQRFYGTIYNILINIFRCLHWREKEYQII